MRKPFFTLFAREKHPFNALIYLKRQEEKGKAHSKKNERAKRIWNKYGLPGLALLGPILIGTHIAAFIGMTLGATKKNTTLWLTISIAMWTLFFGLATAFGFDFFTKNL
ncbi:hypothetical protein [Planococcus shenhongbingii]|uniref:hypothetical protein n=1 Tax=Planococcus shenhongbingii TaxID=3058398 RepID=UPI003F54223D